MRASYVIPAAIVVGGAIVAFAVYFSLHPSEPSTASGSGDPALVRPLGANDHVLGSPNAPITVIEYADYDCSYCRDFSATLHELVARYGPGGKVAWVYRNLPLTALHPYAYKAAVAAECVALTAGNDSYWRFADALFANQPADPLAYAQYAKAAGANPDAVATCEENASSTVGARIDADIRNAEEIGARGTPYSLILAAGTAPVVLDGAVPYDYLAEQVSALLAR